MWAGPGSGSVWVSGWVWVGGWVGGWGAVLLGSGGTGHHRPVCEPSCPLPAPQSAIRLNWSTDQEQRKRGDRGAGEQRSVATEEQGSAPSPAAAKRRIRASLTDNLPTYDPLYLIRFTSPLVPEGGARASSSHRPAPLPESTGTALLPSETSQGRLLCPPLPQPDSHPPYSPPPLTSSLIRPRPLTDARTHRPHPGHVLLLRLHSLHHRGLRRYLRHELRRAGP
jgi:hypothetical protein